MKLAIYALAAAGLFGVASMLAPDERGADTFLTASTKKADTLPRFQLSVTGSEGSCEVGRRGPAEAKRTELQLEKKCALLLPRLADARYWQEGQRGEVIFAAEDGRTIVEFFAADGVAYESLKPATPLVALTVK